MEIEKKIIRARTILGSGGSIEDIISSIGGEDLELIIAAAIILLS